MYIWSYNECRSLTSWHKIIIDGLICDQNQSINIQKYSYEIDSFESMNTVGLFLSFCLFVVSFFAWDFFFAACNMLFLNIGYFYVNFKLDIPRNDSNNVIEKYCVITLYSEFTTPDRVQLINSEDTERQSPLFYSVALQFKEFL